MALVAERLTLVSRVSNHKWSLASPVLNFTPGGSPFPHCKSHQLSSFIPEARARVSVHVLCVRVFTYPSLYSEPRPSLQAPPVPLSSSPFSPRVFPADESGAAPPRRPPQ